MNSKPGQTEVSPPTATTIDVSSLTRALWAATFAILAIGLIRNVLVTLDLIEGTGQFMDLDGEQSLPAWFATMQLGGAAVLLALHAARARATHPSQARYFTVLAVIFVYLSIDEASSIHEQFSLAFPPMLSPGFIEHRFTWVLVMAPLLLLGGLAFVPFLLSLPRNIMILIVISGTVYVLGAAGVELVGGYIVKNVPGAEESLAYMVSVFIEEGLELTGITLFLIALLRLFAQERTDIRFVQTEPA